jgi:uncharacterized membrane protein
MPDLVFVGIAIVLAGFLVVLLGMVMSGKRSERRRRRLR